MRKFIRFLVRRIPRPVLIKCSGVFSVVAKPFYKGDKVECPICNSHFRKFLPYGNKGIDNRLCPKCLSLERHRLIWFYLKQCSAFFSENLKMLHIAPEQPFIKRFKKMDNLEYKTADLVSPIADMHFDVMKIPLPDNLYDVIICNHVLEHVENDIAAMKELYRILKSGGWAILQVPIDCKRESTYEDFSITDPKERERTFGQYDHVRIYGNDYASRLESAGFTVETFSIKQHLTIEQIERCRIDGNEIIYIARK